MPESVLEALLAAVTPNTPGELLTPCIAPSISDLAIWLFPIATADGQRLALIDPQLFPAEYKEQLYQVSVLLLHL